MSFPLSDAHRQPTYEMLGEISHGKLIRKQLVRLDGGCESVNPVDPDRQGVLPSDVRALEAYVSSQPI